MQTVPKIVGLLYIKRNKHDQKYVNSTSGHDFVLSLKDSLAKYNPQATKDSFNSVIQIKINSPYLYNIIAVH